MSNSHNDDVYLFHGTSSLRIEAIFRDGLIPGQSQPGKWNAGWTARPDLVYLTDCWAPYYAAFAAARLPSTEQTLHRPVVIKISIDPLTIELFPDEDYIRFVLTHPGSDGQKAASEDLGGLETTEGIDPTEDRWNALGINWQDSLRVTGTVAVKTVPPELIVGYHQMNSMEEFAPFGNENGPLRPGRVDELFYSSLFRDELLKREYLQYPSE